MRNYYNHGVFNADANFSEAINVWKGARKLVSDEDVKNKMAITEKVQLLLKFRNVLGTSTTASILSNFTKLLKSENALPLQQPKKDEISQKENLLNQVEDFLFSAHGLWPLLGLTGWYKSYHTAQNLSSAFFKLSLFQAPSTLLAIWWSGVWSVFIEAIAVGGVGVAPALYVQPVAL